jgi:hypothetical protein
MSEKSMVADVSRAPIYGYAMAALLTLIVTMIGLAVLVS